MDYRERITIDVELRSGKPCIRGMRITAYDILGYLASGMSQEEILANFPYLEADDILASLAFAADGEEHDRLAEFPLGWDEKRVRTVLGHYEEQTEGEVVAEDEAAFEDLDQTFMEIPKDLVPEVRSLITGHKTRT